MSHRLTKEQLDEQFELFLKESDSGDSEKQLGVKSSQKYSQKTKASWWQDEEPSGGGAGRAEMAKKRFIKSKKAKPENTTVVSVDPVLKPVPKPRCKPPDQPVQLDNTHSDAVLEGSPDDPLSEDPPADSFHSPSQRDSGDGLLGFGKTFRKSLRKAVEEEDDPGGLKEVGPESAILSSDTTELEDTLMVPAGNMTGIGLDTIEEEEEKARFFAHLEAGALSTIDYSKLNRALDSKSSTLAPHLREADAKVEQSEDQRRGTEISRESPALTGPPHYSDDFEEEENVKEVLEEKPKMSSILAKVSLHDSLEDTEDRRKDSAGSLDRGQAYVQSGGSEMEAVHEAYRQIQVVEDSEDHYLHYSSLEGRGAIPITPLPQHTTQSLQPADTNESAITLTLAVGFIQEQTSGSFETTSPESLLKPSGRTDPVAEIKGGTGLASLQSSSPGPANLTWNIRHEVERLIQDENKYSADTSSRGSKAKKQQASRGSCVSHSSTSSVRKLAVAPVRGRRVEGRTAGACRTSGPSRAAAAAKTQNSVPHPLQHPQEKAKSSKNQEKEDHTDPDMRVSSELVASVQSLVAVLQQQIHTCSPLEATHTQEVRSPQETRPTHLPHHNREEVRSLVEELRMQLAQKERELQAMKEGAEEMTSLKKQNYLLQSKLQSAEDERQKRKLAEASDSTSGEKLQQLDREIKEQETLLKGYQQENEKLYAQIKAQQAQSKSNEEAMFNENQRLLSKLTFTSEQLKNTSRTVGSVCLMDHTQRITDLLAQMNTLQRNEATLCEDILRLKQEKQVLAVDLQLMRKERDLAKAQAMSASGDKSFEMRVLDEKHREEVSSLSKKLQWFAENQELLDRDAGRLKAATTQIQQLKEQVEKLKSDVGKRGSEAQTKTKDKTVETKRMQDLQRQVKELEQILRRRNPNSLPALIYAAATAGGAEEGADGTSPPSRISALQERRIQRLEAELEGHDEGTKRSLRAMEQQFLRIKLRYEQQISELEQQLERKQQLESAESAAGGELWRSKAGTLQVELQQVKQSHQEKEKSLQEQIEALQQQLKLKPQPSPGRRQHQAEAAFGVRIERLNKELALKTQSIQELSRTVDRLQRERRSMLSAPPPAAESKRPAAKSLSSAAAGETVGGVTFPAAQYEKTYQPTVFTGSHISEVVQESEALMQQVELLQLQREQEREVLTAQAEHAKEELSRVKQQGAEQLSSMKAAHHRALDTLRAGYALEHSSSRVAELTNQLHTQEVTVKYLEEQLTELQGAREALTVSRTREDALQKQLSRLLKDLKEATDAQSPEVKLLCGLERKILSMDLRHQSRERELQQVIGGSWPTLDSDQQSEVESWKRLAQQKSREVEAFRLELDSILDILRHLQRQGVVLPPPETPPHRS
ncbi:centrosomal protein of 162 kDa [Eleginops maclovinus]|uniref:centrosomal protein of 162 kDa n=1 Tax=Eleginops maclovinus TaxID=56733 RepID=UPI003080AD44